jgi:hypothetical protein
LATISNTPRPGYVWDATDNVWYPIGVGGHGHPDYITQATAVNPTIIDAKGDIITATAADTPARLAVGTANQVLTVDSSTATGLKWATPASGALTLITRQSFSNVAGTGTTFDGVFTSTYKSYLVIIETIVGATYADDFQLQFRYAGPTTQASAYYGSSITTDYSLSTVSNTQTSNASQATLNLFIGTETAGPTSGYLYIAGVGNMSEKGTYKGSIFSPESYNLNIVGGATNTSRTYTGFLLKSASSNVTGTVAVYGLATA